MKRLVRLLAILGIGAVVSASPAAAQVVFDAASNTAAATASTANPVTVTWNHTTGLAKKAALARG